MIALTRTTRATFAMLAAASALAGCRREERRFRESPPATTPSAVRVSALQPGTVADTTHAANPYESSAYAQSEWQRLFGWYNCAGCHANGGGGMGPPLMDDEWIYGSSGENIYNTIIQGRPNGMPSFRGKLGDDQVWQLAAYVRSMSGLLAKDVASGRNDDMQGRSQEQSTTKATPEQAGPPGPPTPP